MKRIIRRVVLWVLVVGVVVVFVAWAALNSIVKKGIESGAGFALGVDTDVNAVSLSLVKGEFTLDEMTISNPEGFRTAHLMRLDRFEIGLQTSTLLSRTIRLREFVLDGLDVHIEQKLTASNVSVILDNLKRFESKDKADRPSGKRVKIDHLLIKNVVAHVHLLSDVTNAPPLTIRIPQIELTDVTSDNPEGILISELAGRIVVAVLAGIAENGEGILSGDMLKTLRADIADAAKVMGEDVARLVGQVAPGIVKMLPEGLQKTLEGLKKSTGVGLGDLFGGGEKDDEEPK